MAAEGKETPRQHQRSSCASTRPRRDGRGRTEAALAERFGISGFNEAAARWPRKDEAPF